MINVNEPLIIDEAMRFFSSLYVHVVHNSKLELVVMVLLISIISSSNNYSNEIAKAPGS